MTKSFSLFIYSLNFFRNTPKMERCSEIMEERKAMKVL
jgi:hypothetical protein